ncbi:MAG TPA: sulfatase-like hydrolase/transferase, partial [Pseudomonadota bacterium]|nr:sulfatase-like hydrolase/transferase [Pseudomonadota bacterium]
MLSRRSARIYLWACLFVFTAGPLLGWLLWPLASRRFHIVDDVDKLAAKQAFLLAQVSRALPARGVSGGPPARRPNIVVLLADDLGKTDISLYGSPHIKTPNIDSIGRGGATFTEGYITSPICAPSRAGLLTGRYQQRFGFEIINHERYARNRLEYYVFKYILARGDWRVAEAMAVPTFDDILAQGLPASEITLAELLKPLGYRTAIIGKWHLGSSPQAIPSRRGFDYQYGFYGANTLYANPRRADIVNQRHEDFSDRFMWSAHREGNCVLRRNDEPVDDDLYLTTRLAKESSAFIRANKDAPFFLYVPFSAPHTPFQVPREYFDRFASETDANKRVYLGMIAALDDAVGEVLTALRETGLDEQTLVFFLSDNGGATYTRATDNAPLRGGKFTNFEGGINIPFLLKWKGHIPEGVVFNPPVSALDVFATAAAVAGSPLPTDRAYDGVDLLPHLGQAAPA